MADISEKLNIIQECHSVQMSWWQCPPVLFIGLGIITIFSLITTSVLASRYFEEPELPTVVGVSVEAIVFLVIGNIIIGGFNKIAEANRMKTEFISIISHQLRAPLTALQWTEDIIEREFKKHEVDVETVQSFVNTLREATHKMTRLIATLLDVSRVDAKTLVLHKKMLSLPELTKGVIKEFYQYANSSNITIGFEAEDFLPEISADPERTEMVIRNFIDNSIRYTANSGNIKINISRAGNSFVRWTIHDEGMGITPHERRRIFDKFFRGRSATLQQAEGSGVGLYVARAIIDAAGGKVGFSSEPGRGSEFWFTLPIK
ncbi:MAG: HAMP domain-containing histidine kinase [Candidatus Sungbacteria bacterium]|nr:HAMP domain-containing histidine kinase [Candidatus Sungbacteria bacterium]